MVSTPVVSRSGPPRTTRPTGRPARRRRRRSRRPAWLKPVAVVVAVAAVLLVVWRGQGEHAGAMASTCTVPGTDLSVTTEQAANAATIAAVARSRGLPPRATVIALATAQQESRLRNLDYGDRDSLGLFQQRPSQGWGSAEQVQDPVFAAGTFFDKLLEVPGWETGRLTEVSQAVQRSGFPEAYQQWEPMATRLAGALLATSPTALSCGFAPVDTTGTLDERTAVLTGAVRSEAGPPTVQPDGSVSVDGAGWPEATWAVAHAERLQLGRVSFDGWRWTPTGGWESSPAAMAAPLQLVLSS